MAPTKLGRGARVEIAPYRGGRFFYSYAEYDGCQGRVVEVKEGGKVRVNVETEHAGRSGGMDVPLEALRPVEVT